MHQRFLLLTIIVITLFTGCAVSNKNYNPNKKYSVSELQHDYTLLRNILEKKHPSLYWYTPKDSMDYFFDKGYKSISDSMTELQFGWNVLAPLISKIHCGHTSFSMSKGWHKFVENVRIPSFPLELKVWADTMVVTANLNPKDSVIKNGMLITSINGIWNRNIIQKMFSYLPQDGYSNSVKYSRLSNDFPFYHRNIFGIYQNYLVGYLDSTGEQKQTWLPMFIPGTDSSKEKKEVATNKVSKRALHEQVIESYRSFAYDTTLNTAIITLNTFSKGGKRHLRHFIKKSFKIIKKKKIKNAIVDLRNNGGGDIDMYILLTKYLRNTPFKAADTVFALAKSLSPYTKYIKHGFWNNIGLFLLTKKHKDGMYHYGYWEKHVFKPKSKNHFDGKGYVLIGGPTFSASTLFCNEVKGQSNIKLVGEETGGGWYGNDGIIIPDIILPKTKIRVRLPLFRIVQYKHIAIKGTGVIPDISVPPTLESVRKGIDRKMEIVKEMIRKDESLQ